MCLQLSSSLNLAAAASVNCRFLLVLQSAEELPWPFERALGIQREDRRVIGCTVLSGVFMPGVRETGFVGV